MFENWVTYSPVTLWVKNFVKIAPSSKGFFAILAKNSKWLPFLVGQKFFENWVNYSAELSYGSKIASKSLYLARFSRYKHFCVLHFFFGEKNSKIQNGCHFWRVKYLLKLGKASLHRYPVGQKSCRNPTSKFLFYEENGFKKYSYIT